MKQTDFRRSLGEVNRVLRWYANGPGRFEFNLLFFSWFRFLSKRRPPEVTVKRALHGEVWVRNAYGVG